MKFYFILFLYVVVGKNCIYYKLYGFLEEGRKRKECVNFENVIV